MLFLIIKLKRMAHKTRYQNREKRNWKDDNWKVSFRKTGPWSLFTIAQSQSPTRSIEPEPRALQRAEPGYYEISKINLPSSGNNSGSSGTASSVL